MPGGGGFNPGYGAAAQGGGGRQIYVANVCLISPPICFGRPVGANYR